MYANRCYANEAMTVATSDGISNEDWDLVHEFAVAIVNASGEEEANLRRKLLAYLDELERKYGVLPSILATRADYIDEEDTPRRIELLTRAHTEATNRGDVRNQLYSAASIAGLYVRDLADVARGRHWLGIATALLTEAGDSSDADELNEIAETLEHLESRQ
jgi:hypothetical protein